MTDRSVEGDAALLLVDAAGRLRNPDARQVGTKQIHRPAPKMVQCFPTLRSPPKTRYECKSARPPATRPRLCLRRGRRRGSLGERVLVGIPIRKGGGSRRATPTWLGSARLGSALLGSVRNKKVPSSSEYNNVFIYLLPGGESRPPAYPTGNWTDWCSTPARNLG